jgi:phospholipase A1
MVRCGFWEYTCYRNCGNKSCSFNQIGGRMKYLFAVYTVLIFISPLLAEGGPDHEQPNTSVRENEPDGNSEDDSITEKLIGLSSHKPNYVLPFVRTTYHDRYRQKSEMQYQISFKQRIFRIMDMTFYLAYSQRSFWQCYNGDRSRPVRENNYNPEAFIRSGKIGAFRLDLGYEHESNGRDLPDSRGWDRVHCTPSYENEYLRLRLKGWVRISRRRGYSENDPYRDDNADISRYYGYAELYCTLKYDAFQLTMMIRGNPAYRKGAFQADASYPLRKNNIYLIVQYFDGYGASLEDYRRYQRKVGIGFMLTR